MLQSPQMSQQISAEAANLIGFAGATPAEAPEDLGPQNRTALDCLAEIAAHHGVDLSADRPRHAYVLDRAPISRNLSLRMAKETGLRARATQLNWTTLIRLGEAYPRAAAARERQLDHCVGGGAGAK